MNAPSVDILALTYNHERFLPSFLESVLRQTYITQGKIRLILVDDCSPDQSIALVQKYYSTFLASGIEVVHVINGSNLGFFDSFDIGRKYVRSDYTATLETDDYYSPKKLEESIIFMENNPEFVAMHTDINSLWEDGRYEEHSWKKMDINQLGQETPYPYLLQDNRCYTCTVVMKSGIFLSSPPDSEWKERGYKMGDYPRLLWLAKRHKIGYLDRNLSTYRIHAKSASHNPDTFQDFVKSYQQIKEDGINGLI